MVYRMICDVESSIRIERDITFTHGRKFYRLKADPQGKLQAIMIDVQGIDPGDFDFDVQRRKPVRRNTAVQQELIREFQYLEGALGYYTELRRIRWNCPAEWLIPENSAERRRFGVRGYRFGGGSLRQSVPLQGQWVRALIRSKPKLDRWTVPLAFFREGQIAFWDGRFIVAFYYFYFVVEGFYGNGKTKNYQVEKAFMASTELCTLLKEQVTQVRRSPSMYEQILQDLRAKNWQLTLESLIKLIVDVRGRLHHYNTSPASLSSLLDQARIEGLAQIIMVVSRKALARRLQKSLRIHQQLRAVTPTVHLRA